MVCSIIRVQDECTMHILRQCSLILSEVSPSTSFRHFFHFQNCVCEELLMIWVNLASVWREQNIGRVTTSSNSKFCLNS